MRRTSTLDFTKFSLVGSRRASINVKGDGAIEKNYDHMDESFRFDNIPESQMENTSQSGHLKKAKTSRR